MPEKKRGLRRYTAEECALIRREYAAFVPLREIANKLGRNANDIGQKNSPFGITSIQHRLEEVFQRA